MWKQDTSFCRLLKLKDDNKLPSHFSLFVFTVKFSSFTINKVVTRCVKSIFITWSLWNQCLIKIYYFMKWSACVEFSHPFLSVLLPLCQNESVQKNSRIVVSFKLNSFNLRFHPRTRFQTDLVQSFVYLNTREQLLYLVSGSARVFGYRVYRGFLNRVYGILQLKYGYSVYHFLWIVRL